jgi:uncharacterized protein (DUF58 family)
LSRYGVHRWTTLTYLLLVGGAALLVAAVVTRNPVPVFFGLALLLAPFAAAWTYPRALNRVDLAWEEVGAGPTVRVRGSLNGSFGDSAGDVSVGFASPREVVVAKELTYDRDPRSIRFATDWRLREPYISRRITAVVSWSDPLGLGERVLDGNRPDLTVERSPPDLRTLTFLGFSRKTPLPGEVRSRRASMSGEFDGLRWADAHEPARFINWKATARIGRLVANEYEAELRPDVILLLDLRPASRGRYDDELLLNLGRAACLGLVKPFLRIKLRFGFASFGEFVEAVPLSTGRGHGYRVVQAILASRLAARAGVVQRCPVGMSRFYPPGTPTIIVSGWAGDPTLDLAPHLRRIGFPVVTLSPSPLPMREGTGGLDATREALACRVEHLERRIRLSHLWDYGPVVDWDNYWSLEGLGLALRMAGRRKVG